VINWEFRKEGEKEPMIKDVPVVHRLLTKRQRLPGGAYAMRSQLVIASSPFQVFDVLRNVPGWSAWWPGLRVTAVGSVATPSQESDEFDLHQRGVLLGSRVRLRLTELTLGKRLRFEYVDGELRGDGEWLLIRRGSGSLVTFAWNRVKPHGLLPWLGMLFFGAAPYQHRVGIALKQLKLRLEEPRPVGKEQLLFHVIEGKE